MKISNNPYPAVVTLIVLIAGIIGGVSYGFYSLLQWIVTISSIFYAYQIYENAKYKNISFLFAISALVFNPLIPFYLGRSLWVLVDILDIVLFAYYLMVINKGSSSITFNVSGFTPTQYTLLDGSHLTTATGNWGGSVTLQASSICLIEK